MVRKLRIWAAAALAFAAVHAAATPTLLGTTANPTGVDGLLVDGVVYDVTFSSSSYLTTYSSPATFLGNVSGAKDASVALATALNSLGVNGLGGLNCPANADPSGGKAAGGCMIETPYFHGGGSVNSQGTSWWDVPSGHPNAWIGNYYSETGFDVNPQGVFTGNADFASQAFEYAVYTIESSSIPEPASVLLVGLGCALLVVKRRPSAAPRISPC